MTQLVLPEDQANLVLELRKTLEEHGSALVHGSLVRDVFATWQGLRRAVTFMCMNVSHDDYLDLVRFWDLKEGETLPEENPFPKLLVSKNQRRRVRRHQGHTYIEISEDLPCDYDNGLENGDGI